MRSIGTASRGTAVHESKIKDAAMYKRRMWGVNIERKGDISDAKEGDQVAWGKGC